MGHLHAAITAFSRLIQHFFIDSEPQTVLTSFCLEKHPVIHDLSTHAST